MLKNNQKLPDHFELQNYLDTLKLNNKLSVAFINSKGELILKSKDETKIEYLKKWSNDDFKNEITEILKKN